MGIHRRGWDYTPATRQTCVSALSPRARNALWLYETSLVPTKAAAARAVGMSPATFYARTSGANAAERDPIAASYAQTVKDRVMSIRQIIDKHSHRAIARIADLMEDGDSNVALRAAIDMADRGSETAKATKLEVGPSLSSEDVQKLALGLVEAARLARQYQDIGQKDIIRLPGTVE